MNVVVWVLRDCNLWATHINLVLYSARLNTRLNNRHNTRINNRLNTRLNTRLTTRQKSILI